MKDTVNIPASIKARLQNIARKSNRPFSELLQQFGMERFIFRFSKSAYSERFFLKGALMFLVWDVPERRGTLDIDFLGNLDNQIPTVEKAIREICKTEVASDGIVFDVKTVKGMRIKEDAEYPGIRVKFVGFLEKARIPMQIDIGFGDVVYPEIKSIKYPVILDYPSPVLQGYPIETVVSEKFEAMIKLQSLNSRMKDFYDLWLIFRRFDLKKAVLSESIRRTFKSRKTTLPNKIPFFDESILDESSDRQKLWTSFLKKNNIQNAPIKLAIVAEEIQEYIREVL